LGHHIFLLEAIFCFHESSCKPLIFKQYIILSQPFSLFFKFLLLPIEPPMDRDPAASCFSIYLCKILYFKFHHSDRSTTLAPIFV
jgi:hypothetical protein